MKLSPPVFKGLAGERVLQALPPLAPYADDAGDGSLRRRLYLFPSRTLTHLALLQEQRSRIADAMRLGQAVAPGVVDGLEVLLEPLRRADGSMGHSVVLMPGRAIAPDGQDLQLSYPLRVDADRMVVWTGDPRAPTLGTRRADAALSAGLAHAMVLVARPLTMVIDRVGGGNDPCVNAAEPELNAALAWEDGFQLAWVPWPASRPLPPWESMDGAGDGGLDARFRNRVAYAIFNAERERLSQSGLRSLRRWQAGAAATASADNVLWPWEPLGVPLAVVGFDAAFAPVYADRAAVVRQGGGRRNRAALVPMAGDDVLWQARVGQWVEHLAELPPALLAPEAFAARFDWLPPAGIVPRTLADMDTGRQWLFPPGFDVQAQPVPLEMVDALIAESAPLLPFNLSLRDQVQLLVPVPAASYEPGLLDLRPRVHPLFDLEINRLRGARSTLLQRRDGLRRRWDLLLRCITGSWPAYPQDDPDALPDERGAADAAGLLRVRRARAAAGGVDVHGFDNAHVPLDVAPGDEAVVFVRFDAAPAAVGLRLLEGPRADAKTPVMVMGDQAAAAGRVVLGPLPPPEAGAPGAKPWMRLAFPMASAGLATTQVSGIELHVYAGNAEAQVVWGAAGKARGGFETVWLGDALPPGAQAFGDWRWEEQGTPFTEAEDHAVGLPLEAAAQGSGPQAPPRRQVAEVVRLLADWKAFKNGVLLPELGELDDAARAARAAAGQNSRRVVDEGLDALLVRLDGRIRSANDHVDLGFLRARTDVFRVRQGVLGNDSARRFLTSASAAELVDRNENPVATEQAFADYFKRLDQNIDVPPFTPKVTVVAPVSAPVGAARAAIAPAAAAPAAAAARGAVGAGAAVSATTGRLGGSATGIGQVLVGGDRFGNVSTGGSIGNLGAIGNIGNVGTVGTISTVGTIGGTVSGGSGRDVFQIDRGETKVGVEARLDLGSKSELLQLDTGLATGGKFFTTPGGAKAAEVPPPPLASEPTPAVDAVVGASLLGATLNDVTVADRFGISTSVLTSNAAAKGKGDFVRTGSAGLKGSGLVIDDLPVFGYGKPEKPNDPEAPLKTDLKIGDLDATALDLDAGEPAGEDLHEAVYFKRGIDAIDNLVRFLRGVELRAEDYRRLQADASATRSRMQAAVQRLGDGITTASQQLAEVRHDLSVAQALRAEEAARLAALVERRRAVLREQVPYLVFRRPRTTPALADVPLLAMQPAMVDDPVPRCRGQSHTMPPELAAMVDTLKDVPTRWLRPLVRDFGRFDQLSDLRLLLGQAGKRLAEPPVLDRLVLEEGAQTTTGTLILQRFEQHAQSLLQVRETSRQRITQVDASSWKQATLQVQEVVAVRDILTVAPASHPVTLLSAGLLDDIGGVAACLHAALCETPAALRLRWAQAFSQFDAAVSLRQLSTLPGFGRPSPTAGTDAQVAGNEALAWRRMQGMVDWLFAQVVDEPAPVRAIDDLVRVCVLLAAHAPVKRIVSARVRRPVPAIRGAVLDLALDVRTVRVGMQVLVHHPVTRAIVARAVVEDLHDAGASARITQVMAQQGLAIDETMRVQLQQGAALSSPAVAEAERMAATTTNTLGVQNASKGAAAAATEMAAERGMALQVQKLAARAAVQGRKVAVK